MSFSLFFFSFWLIDVGKTPTTLGKIPKQECHKMLRQCKGASRKVVLPWRLARSFSLWPPVKCVVVCLFTFFRPFLLFFFLYCPHSWRTASSFVLHTFILFLFFFFHSARSLTPIPVSLSRLYDGFRCVNVTREIHFPARV